MGLDMYLKGRRYISKYFKDSDEAVASTIAEQFPELASITSRVGGSPVNEVIAEVGYWRKANQIHHWFVNNVQAGEDDCGTYRVSRDELQELRDTCERVLGFKNLAETQLPTGSGFFFGSTDYDEYYYSDLEDTIKIIDEALALPREWEFEYYASW